MAKHIGAVAYLEVSAKEMSSSIGDFRELITFILCVGIAGDGGLFLKGQKFDEPQEGKKQKKKQQKGKREKEADSKCISQ